MDWESPKLLLLAAPLMALLLWIESRSAHPMQGLRKRLLLIVRSVLVLLALLALAGPARVLHSKARAVVFLIDHSQSMGTEGLQRACASAAQVRDQLGASVQASFVAVGDEPALLESPAFDETRTAWQQAHGGQTNLQAALEFARALFPAGTSRSVVLITDGHETRGSLAEAARQCAVTGVQVHVLGVAGPRKPDVRVKELLASHARLHEGASLMLTAKLDATMAGSGTLRLFENGVEVEQRALTLKPGEGREEVFTRSPPSRNIYQYRAVLDGFAGDALPGNNDALAIVDVRGRLRLLYCESDPSEGRYLVQAMEREGIQLDLRQPGNIPQTLNELAGYDGIIVSDVPARLLGEGAMNAMRDYVDKLGGGFVMIGGPQSFGVGGYYRTPIEDVLPVRMKSPDDEEKQSSAIALVLDRSGSMAGEKLETAKSAAVAASEVLGHNDSIGVFAFDSDVHVVAPMARVTSTAAIAGQIASLTSGGGTNLEPAFRMAREQLQRAKAKLKHMIVLTDGETTGSGYEQMASQIRGDGITISTVAIGEGSHVGLLQAIAAAGGGQAYTTNDASGITRIFTQDTLMHTGRMLREEAFFAQATEKHPMLAGIDDWKAVPSLLGYVKTTRKATAQVPLTTDSGDPLLAHWRFGLGKTTAFTSDAKSRWASLWLARWSGFGRFWGQVLRETARAPQGQRMDVHTELQGDEALVSVDLLDDAGTRTNNASATAEVFYVAANALGAPVKPIAQLTLTQSGPGLYEGRFRPDQAGLYLVRAQSGAEMVSAGIVRNLSSEASLGTVNEALLADAAKITGGTVLKDQQVPQLHSAGATQFVELWPPIVVTLVLLFLVDIAIRRWEHVVGLAEMVRGK